MAVYSLDGRILRVGLVCGPSAGGASLAVVSATGNHMVWSRLGHPEAQQTEKMAMRFTHADLAAYEAREAARKRGTNPTEGVEREKDLPATSFAVRLTTDEEKLNKTERAFLTYLRAHPGEVGAWIGIQSVTLKLGDDCRYTPDFFCVGSTDAVAWEVKGFMRDDALVKLKTAARAFPWIKFILVKRDKDTPEGWNWRPINP